MFIFIALFCARCVAHTAECCTLLRIHNLWLWSIMILYFLCRPKNELRTYTRRRQAKIFSIGIIRLLAADGLKPTGHR